MQFYERWTTSKRTLTPLAEQSINKRKLIRFVYPDQRHVLKQCSLIRRSEPRHQNLVEAARVVQRQLIRIRTRRPKAKQQVRIQGIPIVSIARLGKHSRTKAPRQIPARSIYDVSPDARATCFVDKASERRRKRQPIQASPSKLQPQSESSHLPLKPKRLDRSASSRPSTPPLRQSPNFPTRSQPRPCRFEQRQARREPT